MHKTTERFLAIALLISTSIAGAAGPQKSFVNPDDPAIYPTVLLGNVSAMDGDTLVVGAPNTWIGNKQEAGAVIVYRRGEFGMWKQEAVLTPPTHFAFQRFGQCVDISGPRVVVGDPSTISSGAGKGGVHVFWRVNEAWVYQTNLRPANNVAWDEFGAGVAIDGDRIVGGAPTVKRAGVGNPGCAYVFERGGGLWFEKQEIFASDRVSNDRFGDTIAISGNTILVGATNGGTVTANSGSAYVFTHAAGTWTQQAELGSSVAVSGDDFGSRLALSGDVAVVGTPLALSGNGTVSVFKRNGVTWTGQVLADPTPNDSDRFGSSVATDGTSVLIGSPRNDNKRGAAFEFTSSGGTWTATKQFTQAEPKDGAYFGTSVAMVAGEVAIGAIGINDESYISTGAAYIYKKTGVVWGGEQLLAYRGSPAGDRFGSSVAISDSSLILGAPLDNQDGLDSGSAVAYRDDGTNWQLKQRIVSPDFASGDKFGYAVATTDYYAVFGAPLDDDLGPNSGSAYVYVRRNGTWIFQQKLLASDGISYDHFGEAVAISSDTIVVGAPFDNAPISNNGSVYIFERTDDVWTQTAKLLPSDPNAEQYFGNAVAIQAHSLIVGAYGDSSNGSQSGAAYVFDYSNSAWTQTKELRPGVCSSGDRFGYSVAFHGDTYILGGPNDDLAGLNAGSAVAYKRNGSTFFEYPPMVAPDPAAEDSFGSSVGVFNERIVIGAPREEVSDNVASTGSAYLFIRGTNGGVFLEKFTSGSPKAGDSMGNAVAIWDNRVICGAFQEDNGQYDSGGAHLFNLVVADASTAWEMYE